MHQIKFGTENQCTKMFFCDFRAASASKNQRTWRQKISNVQKINAPDLVWYIDFGLPMPWVHCFWSAKPLGAFILVADTPRCIDFGLLLPPGASIFGSQKCIEMLGTWILARCNAWAH